VCDDFVDEDGDGVCDNHGGDGEGGHGPNAGRGRRSSMGRRSRL
jgi:hypothetical protein